jgi:hypothetical protein
MSKYILFIFVFFFVTITVFSQELKEEIKNEKPELITGEKLESLFKNQGKDWTALDWIKDKEKKKSMPENNSIIKDNEEPWNITKPLPYALPKDVKEWCEEINDENKDGIISEGSYRLLKTEELFPKDNNSVWPKGMVNMNTITEANSESRNTIKRAYDRVFIEWNKANKKKEAEYSEQEFYEILKWADDNKKWEEALQKAQDNEATQTVRSALNEVATSLYRINKDHPIFKNVEHNKYTEFWGTDDTYYTFEWAKSIYHDNAEYLLKASLEKLSKQALSSDEKRDGYTYFRLKPSKQRLKDDWFKIVRDNRNDPEKLKEYANQIERINDIKIKKDPDMVIKCYQGIIPADLKEEPFFKYYAEGLGKK